MYTIYSLQDHMRSLNSLSSQKEQLLHMLHIYLDVFPAKDAYLFRYSPLGYLGEGVIGLTDAGFVSIGDIRDDLRTLSIIYNAVCERKTQFSSGEEYFLKYANSKYASRFSMDCLVVTPIPFERTVIGYICTTNIAEGVVMDEDLLSSLTMFGQLAGSALNETLTINNDSSLLSNRELEVMRRIAKGESTKDMADYMDISEFTVKQYVKSAIKKLGAQNRAHAVAVMFQRGLLKG
ncbi:regulatory protein, luxR family [Alteribacillus persepolensis]|uniref:Regulatory protein, luxR family n=1 Tax=Alteribacillus persepolensis TaxID=568899 RepID=A0A1G8H281_9BACI|nr:LuxR C-terminal-related transcriptional regulator [Alteribacillus persepolensis]SDI00765.1 regulatory protein, luxR family [Alteribacillus persepolensis]